MISMQMLNSRECNSTMGTILGKPFPNIVPMSELKINLQNCKDLEFYDVIVDSTQQWTLFMAYLFMAPNTLAQKGHEQRNN